MCPILYLVIILSMSLWRINKFVFQAVEKFVINRFYLTLMLFELWKQRTIWQVAVEFNQTRGFVQQLLSSAASFASCISHFCKVINKILYSMIINLFLWSHHTDHESVQCTVFNDNVSYEEFTTLSFNLAKVV